MLDEIYANSSDNYWKLLVEFGDLEFHKSEYSQEEKDKIANATVKMLEEKGGEIDMMLWTLIENKFGEVCTI